MTKRTLTGILAGLAAVLAVFSLAFYLGRSSVPFEIAVDTVKRPAVYDSAALISRGAETEDEVAPAALLIDLNAASADELTMLPGIGPALAERIIEYRNEYGRFAAPEQVMDVKGIGESTYEAIKDYLYVEELP